MIICDKFAKNSYTKFSTEFEPWLRPTTNIVVMIAWFAAPSLACHPPPLPAQVWQHFGLYACWISLSSYLLSCTLIALGVGLIFIIGTVLILDDVGWLVVLALVLVLLTVVGTLLVDLACWRRGIGTLDLAWCWLIFEALPAELEPLRLTILWYSFQNCP